MTRRGGSAPGSSARCDQCRRRHKKCDLAVPQCKRCEQSGLQCGGPRPAAIFVHRSTNNFHSQTQKAALIDAYRRRLDSPRRSEEFFNTTMLWIRYLRSLIAENQWLTSGPNDHGARLANQQSHASLYEALLYEFSPRSRGIFSGDRVVSPDVQHYSNVATCIRALLPFSSTRNMVLDHSLLALLSLYYSRLHADAELEKTAYSSYTMALGQYSRLLGKFSPQDNGMSTNAYATFMYISISMHMFENLNGITAKDAKHQPHVNGALKALQGSGPAAIQQSSAMQKAFCGLRGVAVFTAMERRENTFLAEPDWLLTPFKNANKSMRDKLTDLAVRIPGLLQCMDLFSARVATESSPDDMEAGMSLIKRLTQLQREFESWLAMLQSTTSQPLYWPRNSPIQYRTTNQDSECLPKYSNDFHQRCFHSGPIAGMLAHYWTFNLQLNMALIDLHQVLLVNMHRSHENGIVHHQELSDSLIKEKKLADDTAQLILEAEPYLSSCFEGLVCLQAPLGIVASYFQRSNMTLPITEGERP